jgi:hypothetical protein
VDRLGKYRVPFLRQGVAGGTWRLLSERCLNALRDALSAYQSFSY